MLDLYRKRLQANQSSALKANHDAIIAGTFTNAINYKECLVGDIIVPARFSSATTTDVDDDKPYYYLEFLPNEPTVGKEIKIGTIIDVPEDNPILSDYEWWETHESEDCDRACYVNNSKYYRRWMIVDISRYEQDRKFAIEECDWCLHWRDKDTNAVMKQLCVMRVRNSYSSGIREKYYATQFEAQDAVWLPTNEKTKQLYYDDRFLISDNELHPQAYKISAIYTTKPVGISKFVLTQVVKGKNDDTDNMIADNIEKTDESTTTSDEKLEGDKFEIICTNESDDIVYFNEDIPFRVEINEFGNDDLKNVPYDIKWSWEPVDWSDRALKSKDEVLSSDWTKSEYVINVPYTSALSGAHIKVSCIVTDKVGETHEFSWNNLPLEKM